MSEKDAPINPDSNGKTEDRKIELWEFTCRTCNGVFTTDVYEPKYCLHCGANLHFK